MRSTDLLGVAVQFHVEQGSVEAFLLQSEPQAVVVQLDGGGFDGAAEDDAGVRPVLRRRRLAPVPLCTRKAVNCISYSKTGPSATSGPKQKSVRLRQTLL